VVDDLNERVQARIDGLELDHKMFVGQAPYASNAYALAPGNANLMSVLFNSWRERWDRHQPIAWAPGYSVLKDCATCGQAMVGKGQMCPDALSVLREIGIEP
jgi:hypothetical protein